MIDESGRSEFLSQVDVSRETLERLDVYVQLLLKWTQRINLISSSTLDNIWTRHILDSAQLWNLRPESGKTWLDLGSGGGLPGLVVAAIAQSEAPSVCVTLVESDLRKATFLRTAAKKMELSARVFSERAEELTRQDSDIVSARALASLDQLLELASRHLRPGGTCLFPKGARAQSEIACARQTWQFTIEQHGSLTDSAASILKITEISRV